MAAPANVPHHQQLDRKIKLHKHFETVKASITNANALLCQGQLTATQIAAQQNHHIPQLGPGFLSPHYYILGTLPQPGDPLATLVNGFGLQCERHLV